MATGTGWQQLYNSASGNPCIITSTGKYNSSNMFYEAGLTMEYTQDLHLKMSKKIAQLTKVIYALNTKNDEHEDEMESLREAHEDEVQHIVTETHDKIMQYKSKMVDEVDLKRHLQSLEESVELHEHMKRQALAEFEMYRQRMEDSQLCTEAQHTQRVVSMSREVEEMRRDFEEKLRSFGQAQAQFEQDKRRAIDELRTTHRQEVQELLHSQQNQSANSTVDQEKLAELHRAEVEALMERVEELTKGKVHLVEEYEAKLTKAQGYYERELEAMRRTQQLTAEKLLAWKRTEVELRKEFQVQEAVLQRTLGKLRAELQRAQEEARESRDKTNRLQASLTNAEGTIKNLHKQLEEAIQDGEIWVMQLKDTEYELEGSRDRVQQQATEILHKASQIGSLQATHMSHEATIRDLDMEQSRLREKILRLEEERERVLNQSQATDEQHKHQVLSLEQSLREERQGYEKELARLRGKYEEEGVRFKEAQAQALEELSEKHRATQESAQNAAEKENNLLMAEMGQEFEIRRLSLEEQKNCLQQQLDNLKKELSAKLNIANQEVSHLQELVKEGEQNLGSAHSHISSLKDTQEKLCIELDTTRARVRETSNLLTDLQVRLLRRCAFMIRSRISLPHQILTHYFVHTIKLYYKMSDLIYFHISDLQQEVSCRTHRITDLDHEIHSLNDTISTLTRELELKGKEVLRVRSEANQQIRAHEQDLTKRHERELGELSAVHHRETQIMLSDFNKAQELLKDKISALQILLEGTEDKFRNRESRHEDLQVIAELKDMVTEREALVKKLVDDKKFYQLELVNRETGFNKVFNTSPNVGVINPLIKVSYPLNTCSVYTNSIRITYILINNILIESGKDTFFALRPLPPPLCKEEQEEHCQSPAK
uniref:Protein FAM184A/B N-terminal domain-containing protein n=1 Tax=Oncorhynchus tshawytscha TaxID=74940 RepID=A0A8C8J7W6_ONCTS